MFADIPVSVLQERLQAG
jgi:hypothetical protein